MKYYLGEKNIVINCVYIMVILQWGHTDPMVLLTELFSWYQSRLKKKIAGWMALRRFVKYVGAVEKRDVFL